MFRTKKKRIQNDLETRRRRGEQTAFDVLLDDYLSGSLRRRLEQIGVTRVKFYLDWTPDYKCINIDGRFARAYLDIQVEPLEFGLGCDPDEPDDHVTYPLKSAEQFYSLVKQNLSSRAAEDDG